MDKIYDVVIIGGGVIGCGIARELSKYKIRVALLEKECDVALGISGANSGVVHEGFNVAPGTLKAEMNIKGRELFESICNELDVPYKKVGKIVIAKNEDEIKELKKLKETGETNGIKDLKIIEKNEIKKLEPNVNGVAALYSPSAAITSPYLLTIALAENAKENSVEIFLNTKVVGIEKKNGLFIIETNKKNKFKSYFVVNSAGIHSDEIAKMAGIYDYTIFPCRGEYFVIDKEKKDLINSMIYPVPIKELGVLGVHLTPTIDGNILIGPSAEFIDEKENTKTTSKIMKELYEEAKELVPLISDKDFICAFAGIRPKLKESTDFVIEESKKVEGFINLTGIESPGLTAFPAIAKKVVNTLKEKIELKLNKNFNPKRKSIVRFWDLSEREKSELIKKNPNYGEIICRCEYITKQEIIDALHNPLGVKTIKAIKYRTRAGMGRCQGGFCMPKIIKIMEEIFKLNGDGITLKGNGSELFVGNAKND